MHKKHLKWLALTASLSLVLTGCQILPEEETFPASPVIRTYEAEEYKMATVMRGDLSSAKTISCSYMPANQESLGFEVSGKTIEGIYVVSGDEVKAGQLLAELEHEDLSEQIDLLEYQIRVLEVKNSYLMQNWELELELLEVKYLSDASQANADKYDAEKLVVDAKYILALEDNNDSLHIKKLRLQELKADLSQRKLYAAMDGTVTYVRSMQDGEASVEGRVLITISDMDSTAFVVKGDNAVYFEIGQEVVITKGNQEYEAVCINASELGLAEAEQKERAYFRLLQPDPTLESGNSGTIEVILDSREDALYVNKKAIKTVKERQFVYVLNEEGLRESRDVTVGAVFGDCIEILSGLKEGDSVILD